MTAAIATWLKAFDRHLGRMQGTSLETYPECADLFRSYAAKGMTMEAAFAAFQNS